MGNITVLGVGNILMQDDGFGVRLVERLQKMNWPANVKLLDGGTLGMILLPYLEGTEKLLVLDAINAEGEAGDFFCFTGNEVNAYFSAKISVHDLGINDLLAALTITNEPIKETVVMGVKPAIVELGTEMTETVQNKMDEALGKVLAQLKKWDTAPL